LEVALLRDLQSPVPFHVHFSLSLSLACSLIGRDCGKQVYLGEFLSIQTLKLSTVIYCHLISCQVFCSWMWFLFLFLFLGGFDTAQAAARLVEILQIFHRTKNKSKYYYVYVVFI
jgi:hypothetical protein